MDMNTDSEHKQEAHTEQGAPRPPYEPPAITDLGSLMQITAGTGSRAAVDAGSASV
jgi:hypothetical protein